MLQICKNIQIARLAAGKTQKEVADQLQVKPGTYSSWENRVIPDVAILIKLGEIFSIDWTSLVKETIKGPPLSAGHYTNAQLEEIRDLIETMKQDSGQTKKMIEIILKAIKELQVKK